MEVAIKDSKTGEREIDVHIGKKIRGKRILLGLSQVEVAGHLGVSFQQLQKYEKGVNRISGGKLVSLGKLFEVPITYFFDGADGAISSDSDFLSLDIEGRQVMSLIRAFTRIENKKIREYVLKLVGTISESKNSCL